MSGCGRSSAEFAIATTRRPEITGRPVINSGSGRVMTHEVTIRHVDARPTAVVAARISWRTLPTQWPGLLGEVWECLRAGRINGGCPNVMLYRDSGFDVEVGVELRQPCPLTGRVVSSTLPAGEVAMTVHRGPYSELGSAHRQWLNGAHSTVTTRPAPTGRSTGPTTMIPPC